MNVVIILITILVYRGIIYDSEYHSVWISHPATESTLYSILDLLREGRYISSPTCLLLKNLRLKLLECDHTIIDL